MTANGRLVKPNTPRLARWADRRIHRLDPALAAPTQMVALRLGTPWLRDRHEPARPGKAGKTGGRIIRTVTQEGTA